MYLRFLMLIVANFLLINVNGQYFEGNKTPYFPTQESISTHESPTWFNNAKLGIFIHWGLYSVPAYATANKPFNEGLEEDPIHWFKNNSYAEWYLNTLRIKGSPTYEYHKKKYGEDYNYYLFSRTFSEEVKKWDPLEMAELISETGARYVVLTTKHHDGYPLWPTKVTNNCMPEVCKYLDRDIVGELTQAIRDKGMKMGLYYSGGLDWTFSQTPIVDTKPPSLDAPNSVEYALIADAHMRELIAKYEPAILWGDIGYPDKGDILGIAADYYNLNPDGVMNNRWNNTAINDYTTPEYTKYDKIVKHKWESNRGLGYSFGFNQFEDEKQTISSKDLIHLLIDVVSKNGNLLLNIGPKPDGSIPEIQKERLKDLGDWLKINGEAIFDTNPWITFGTKTESGKEIRFTSKGDVVYMFFLEAPSKDEFLKEIVISEIENIEILGSDLNVNWSSDNKGTSISFSAMPNSNFAYVLKLKGQISYLNN